MVSPVLDLEALNTYLPIIEKRAEEYVNRTWYNPGPLKNGDVKE